MKIENSPLEIKQHKIGNYLTIISGLMQSGRSKTLWNCMQDPDHCEYEKFLIDTTGSWFQGHDKQKDEGTSVHLINAYQNQNKRSIMELCSVLLWNKKNIILAVDDMDHLDFTKKDIHILSQITYKTQNQLFMVAQSNQVYLQTIERQPFTNQTRHLQWQKK